MDRPEAPAGRASVDVYLFPAAVGGGLGDIEEVFTVGRRLAFERYPIYLLRLASRPLPHGVDGPLDRPVLRRVRAPVRRADCAVTISPSWGVCVAPYRNMPLGRQGEWAAEARAIEDAYGSERTLQVSLEEFARTLTSRQQTVERYREGGVPTRVIRRRMRRGSLDREAEAFHRAYGKYRGFSVPNLLHLYATFAPSRTFQREFPSAVQVGPIVFPRRGLPWRSVDGGRREWVAYAGPSTATRLLPRLAEAIHRVAPQVRLVVRMGRSPRAAVGAKKSGAPIHLIGPRGWSKRFAAGEVRIVSGSRTLLEALLVGGPFLYFNGVTGTGGTARRHRPEKLVRLLEVWKAIGVSNQLLRDLSNFARLRGVEGVVRRAALDTRWRSSFPGGIPTRGFAPGFERGEEFIAGLVRALPGRASTGLVAEVRRGRGPPPDGASLGPSPSGIEDLSEGPASERHAGRRQRRRRPGAGAARHGARPSTW